MITARELAALLSMELERDNWGDIDPYWIERVGAVSLEDIESDHYNDVEALRKVFERVAERVNQLGRSPRP